VEIILKPKLEEGKIKKLPYTKTIISFRGDEY